MTSFSQQNVALLSHPKSPVDRLLIDHNTGSGKTFLMLRVLDNYFFDPRPKITVFPKDTLCDNFYRTLLEWPSLWRDFFSSQYPAEACMAADHHDWRQRRHERWQLDQGENAKLSCHFDGLTTGLPLQTRTSTTGRRGLWQPSRADDNMILTGRVCRGFWRSYV